MGASPRGERPYRSNISGRRGKEYSTRIFRLTKMKSSQISCQSLFILHSVLSPSPFPAFLLISFAKSPFLLIFPTFSTLYLFSLSLFLFFSFCFFHSFHIVSKSMPFCQVCTCISIKF